MIISADADPLAIAWMSVCKVESAKRITEVVKFSEDLTSIIGSIPAKAVIVFDLDASSIDTDLAATILSKTFVIKDLVSILTFEFVSVYSFSISSVIALKKSWVVSVVVFMLLVMFCRAKARTVSWLPFSYK